MGGGGREGREDRMWAKAIVDVAGILGNRRPRLGAPCPVGRRYSSANDVAREQPHQVLAGPSAPHPLQREWGIFM